MTKYIWLISALAAVASSAASADESAPRQVPVIQNVTNAVRLQTRSNA
jgi:hypothetical protein